MVFIVFQNYYRCLTQLFSFSFLIISNLLNKHKLSNSRLSFDLVMLLVLFDIFIILWIYYVVIYVVFISAHLLYNSIENYADG